MNYKNKKWTDFDQSYLKTFGEEVPIYTPSVYRESRGEIFTSYQSHLHPANEVLPKGLHVHTKFSKSYKNVLRGLHYDDKSWKLIQAVVGDIYLIVLDTRWGSPHYGKWESYILSDKTRDQILVPPGFANGHYALTDCMFHYTFFYDGEYVDETQQKVVKWYDTRFNMVWPTNTPTVHGRDQ